MNLAAKLLPTILATLTAILGLYSGQITDYISAHPTVALIVGAIGAAIANFVPAPQK